MAKYLMSLTEAISKMRASAKAGESAEIGPKLMARLVERIDAQAAEIERLKTALESIARHMSSEWPAMRIENVRAARKALGVSND